MAIDWDSIAKLGGIGKGTPIALQREKHKRDWQKIDEKESRKVRKRSAGRCEARIITPGRRALVRCLRRAFHVHHHLGGFGVRGRGESALAKHKSHLCAQCHEDLKKTLLHDHGNVYRRRAA